MLVSLSNSLLFCVFCLLHTILICKSITKPTIFNSLSVCILDNFEDIPWLLAAFYNFIYFFYFPVRLSEAWIWIWTSWYAIFLFRRTTLKYSHIGGFQVAGRQLFPFVNWCLRIKFQCWRFEKAKLFSRWGVNILVATKLFLEPLDFFFKSFYLLLLSLYFHFQLSPFFLPIKLILIFFYATKLRRLL